VQSLFNYAILACIFTTGFLVSKIFVKTGLATRVVIGFIKLSRGHILYLLLFLIGSSALLSSFIPNAITVLTLIPVLRIISGQHVKVETKAGQLSTPIVLAVIYGSNIGGMASIIGSPAHAVLLGFLPLLERRYHTVILGKDRLNFFSWLSFGIPTAILLVLFSWVLIYLLLVPKKLKKTELDFSLVELHSCPTRLRRVGMAASILILCTWVFISLVQTYFPGAGLVLTVLSICLGISFIWFIFFVKFKIPGGNSEVLLTLQDCYSGLPGRGIALAIGAALFSGVLILLRVPEHFGDWFVGLEWIQIMHTRSYYTILAVITTFATEFVSNTTVALTFFPVTYILSSSLGFNVLASLILVSLSSTCAFMSPIATPVNALAFGSVKGVSLGKMMITGFLMNIVSSLWLSYSLVTIVSAVLY